MTSVRTTYGFSRIGTTRMPGKLAVPCPKCGAAPGHSCGRWGGFARSVWLTSKTFHRERKGQR